MFGVMSGFFYLFPRHNSAYGKADSYMIDAPYSEVRKILIKKDSLHELVKLQHGEVLYQEWDNLDISKEKLFDGKGWDINGNGRFGVRTSHPDEGELVLHFRQKVDIKKDSLENLSWLRHPVGNLMQYQVVMKMRPDGDVTRVRTVIYLEYERRLPFGYIEYMDNKVEEACMSALEKSRTGMQTLIARYKGKKIVIPIRRKNEI